MVCMKSCGPAPTVTSRTSSGALQAERSQSGFKSSDPKPSTPHVPEATSSAPHRYHVSCTFARHTARPNTRVQYASEPALRCVGSRMPIQSCSRKQGPLARLETGSSAGAGLHGGGQTACQRANMFLLLLRTQLVQARAGSAPAQGQQPLFRRNCLSTGCGLPPRILHIPARNKRVTQVSCTLCH